MLRALALVVGALSLIPVSSALTSCASLSGTSPSVAGSPRWTIRLLPGGDVDVGGVELRLCFAGRPPPRVRPESLEALPWLMDVPVAIDENGAVLGVLPVDEYGIDTRGLPVSACVVVVVDVEAAARAIDRRDLAQIVGRSILLSPDIWLWRPEPWPAGSAGSLVVDVATTDDSLQFALPFARDEKTGVFVVPPSTFALQSWGAFGTQHPSVVQHAGATFRIARLGASSTTASVDDATFARWLTVAVNDVAAVHGRFPVDNVSVLVVDSTGARAVRGGFLGRGGGASAVFDIGAALDTALDDDRNRVAHENGVDSDGRWVLTHELAHTLLPPVQRSDGWFNEGVATWLQERLPVLAGRRPVDVAEGELALGLRTGRSRAAEDGLTLEQACTQMHARGSYQHCYWGGVALLELLVDDVGVDGVFQLVRALAGRLDAAPLPAITMLRNVSSSAAAPAQAKQAAQRLQALWQQYRHAPFPERGAGDVVEWQGTDHDAADHDGAAAPPTQPQTETPTAASPTSSPPLQ